MTRLLMCLLLAAAAVLVVGGCVDRQAPGPDEVVLMLRATADQLEVWEDAVNAFEEQTQIAVAIQNEPYDSYFAKLQTMIAGGKPPDVVFMESTRFPEFATKGVLENLDPYLARQEDLQPDDFVAAAWDAYQYQGGTYGIPNDIAVLGLAYNTSEFELAMQPPPPPDWTWGDYLKIAQELTADDDDDGRTDVWGTTICPWWQVYVWQNAGDVVDDIKQPRRSTLSTPPAQEALQFLADLHLKHKVAPSMAFTESMGRVDAFSAGKVAMIYLGRWDVPQLAKTEQRWAATVLPKGKVAANLGMGSCFSMPKGAPHAQQAWQLIAFLSSIEGQKKLLTGSFSTPAREALLNSEYFGGHVKGSTGWPFAEGIKVMHPAPFTTRYTEISDIWDDELDLLWSGQKTVQEVTQRIDERVNKVLAESQPATAWLLPVMGHRRL